MASHNETEYLMSIYRAWRLTRSIPIKNTVLENLSAYAESH